MSLMCYSKEDESGQSGKEGKEKQVLAADCDLVTVMEVIKGRLEVTTTHVYFLDRRMNKDEGKIVLRPIAGSR